MKSLVVYESMFGNTEKVADAIGSGLTAYGDVGVVEVSSYADISTEDVDLLVVGGPTHAFGMSRVNTRADAQKQTTQPLVSAHTGIREWLSSRPALATAQVATFDTKVAKARRLPGAARGAAKLLRRRGHALLASESFYVDDTLGPLLSGELERATRWAAALGRRVARPLADRGEEKDADRT